MAKIKSLEAKKHIVQQKLQRESQKSPLPARFSLTSEEPLRNPLDANPITNQNLNVDGSITPVLFEFRPPPTEVFILEHITILLVDVGTFLATEFGSLGAQLTNGLVFRGQQNGVPHEVANIFTNADILRCFGETLGTSAVGTGANQGVFGTSDWVGGRYKFTDEMVLLGGTGDFFLVEVRDDLSGADFLQSAIRVKSIEV